VTDRPKLLTFVALVVLGAACARGQISGGTGVGTGAAGSTGATGAAGAGTPVMPPGGDPNGLLGTKPPAAAVFTPAASTLRRLTTAQYRNTIADLLGPGVTIKTELEADTALDGFASIGAARVSLSATATEEFDAAAFDLAHQALSNTTTRGALVGCTPAGTSDMTCATSFVTTFGRRAWRRDLTPAEITQYATIATNAAGMLKDFWGGLEYGLAGLLDSPHFLYREELGAADPTTPSRRVFSGYELASRLAFLVTNSTPDDTLLDAAKSGKLATSAGLGGEAQRLLALPRAHDAMANFFTELYALGNLDSLPQSPMFFPAVSATLGASMRAETLKVLDDIAFGADYRTLFDTTTTYVNQELASLYGLPAVTGTGFVQATLPAAGPRAGFLGQGSFLAMYSHADSGSPTRRGKFIREVILCHAVPSAPPDVNTTFPVDAPGATQRTTRQKLEQHRMAGSSCAACHQVMDPVGLGLENFDGIGAYRATEAGQAIDASGDLDGVMYTDARGLGAALKNHPDVGSCLTRGVLRYTIGHIETTGEQPVVDALSQQFTANGFKFSSLVLGVVASASFRYAGVPQ
jgi:Protein of unknown function (DUF1588)/Protein of unknown function (DUF1592)/Protein of unknown function (DUF1595)/Protein of unknown function (DUF1585)/Protein of unknown function (DUF1587)